MVQVLKNSYFIPQTRAINGCLIECYIISQHFLHSLIYISLTTFFLDVLSITSSCSFPVTNKWITNIFYSTAFYYLLLFRNPHFSSAVYDQTSAVIGNSRAISREFPGQAAAAMLLQDEFWSKSKKNRKKIRESVSLIK